MIVGMTSGCWDLLHASHLYYLDRCKEQCDRLIVGVDSDQLVKDNKGPHRPIHSEIHRLDLVWRLDKVD